MASASLCDPCTGENLSVPATKYCPDCEELLCQTCTESHTRFKAFKSHYVIDLSTVASNIPIAAKKICNVHVDMLLDYYCTDHGIVCCRACIPKDHRKCENVLPLEHASKNVKKSALFSDIMVAIKHLITTLNDLHENRESNLQSLAQTKSDITKQIREEKSRLLKQMDDVERDLQAELLSFNRKHEIEIIKQKEKISQILVSLNSSKNEIEFLKDHGSDNQLFIFLHEGVTNIQNAEASVLQLISNSNEVVITFDEKKEIKLELFGRLSESVSSCQVQYKSKKLHQAQIMAQPTQHIAGFEMNAKLQLKTLQIYNLLDMCVTNDDKLLLTNFVSFNPKLYVYRDCKEYETQITFSVAPHGVALVPGTDRAVVSLSDEKSIEFINTKMMTKDYKVHVGFTCFGITAGRDRIYVGGENGTIKTLDKNGTILQSIQHGSVNTYSIAYDDSHEQFIVGCPNKLFCINIDGTLVYSKDSEGNTAVTQDNQCNVYYSSYHVSKIQKMSSDGKNCVELMNKVDGIDRPYTMCFNNDFTKLFVINNCYKSVFVYNCRY